MADNEYFGLVMSNLKLNIKDEKKKKNPQQNFNEHF